MAKLKGHAVIELRDVNTGEVERVEHDNMITNALANMFSKCLKMTDQTRFNKYLLDLIKAMGGIYLFDNTLAENVQNTYIPDAASAKLTGYAGDTTSDGNDNMRGDFNISESGEITNGYKFVWDFGTDDANGEIAAIALTHAIAGYHGYHYDTYSCLYNSPTATGNIRGNYKGIYDSSAGTFDLIAQTNILYDCVEITKDTAGNLIFTCIWFSSTTTLEYRKLRYNFETLHIHSNIGFETIESQTITISDNGWRTPSYFYRRFVDGGDGYYYGFELGSTSIRMCKLAKSDLTYTNAVTINLSVTPFDCGNQISNNSYSQPTIRNGYLYFIVPNGTFTRYNWNYDVYKAPLNNLAEVTKINTSTLWNYLCPSCFLYPNGMIDAGEKIIASDDTLIDKGDISLTDRGAFFPYVYDNIELNRWNSNSTKYIKLFPNYQYLATINNLDAPVTKTAAKTMKITYTLTYAT